MSGVSDESRPDVTEADANAAESTGVEPAEAFSIIASEARLDILEALWRADDRPVRFSELHDAVDLVDSAQFNYHLKQLRGHFVKKTDDGYDLTYAGAQVVRAVKAGTFTREPEMDAFQVDGACTRCGGAIEASYDDEQMAITCTDCGKAHGRYGFPPGGLENRDEAEIAQAFDDRVRHLNCLAADGVCPACGGRMHTELAREGECCLDVSLRAEHTCERCRNELCSPVGLVLLDQSAVVSFYDDHDIDLSDRPYWTLPWCVDDEYYTVESADPWRVAVEIPLADERLRVTLDGDLAVEDVTRTSCSGS